MMVVYPSAPRGDAVEVLAGLSFPDPFRALEDDGDPGVRTWQLAQAELVDGYLARLPWLGELGERVACFSVARHPSLPRFAAGRWFRPRYAVGASQAHVVVAAEPLGEGSVVFDPAEHLDELGRTPFLSWFSPSPDGRLLAVGLCYDGSEVNSIRLLEVDSGRVLDDRPSQLPCDDWAGGAQWLPDSRAFFYVALAGSLEEFELCVFRHEVGRPARTVPESVPLVEGAADLYVGVFVSRDGRWVVASQGWSRARPVAVLDLVSGGGWRPFLPELDATLAGEVLGDEYIAVTDVEAPRGRLVAVPLQGPRDSARWRVLVPESDAVLRSVTVVGDLLYLSEFVDTYSRVRVVDRDGTEVGQVPLPGQGAIGEDVSPLMQLRPTGHPDEYVFAFSSLVESWGIYRHRPGAAELETLQAPEVRIDAVVEDLWATSSDGTRVPYHLVRRADVSAGEPQPMLIWAYGGWNVPLPPAFPRAIAAFVEAGGTYVHAHLRGGGEFGREWWEQGRLRQKQNCYADLYAVAEDLIARGRTTSEQLAVSGGSNGGLMAGVAATQRPELWRAAIPRVPFLDVLGACREPFGRAAVVDELGDPDDADDAARLATFSPYQLVRDGTAYPAVYLDVGATDPRCPPWHGRKFAARLQEASSSEQPIFLRVWDNVGHGGATAKDAEIAQSTAWLAFVIDQLGMRPQW